MSQRIVDGKKDADKNNDKLINELKALRDHNSRLKEIIRRYEKVAVKKDGLRCQYDLEASKEGVESLLKELQEKRQETDTRGEELEVLDEELRLQLEELDARDERIARANEALREQESRLTSDLAAVTTLHKISMRFVQEGDLGSLLNDILDAAIKIAGADMGTLQLIRPGSDHPDIVARRGFEQPYIDFFSSIFLGTAAACGTAFMRGERVIVDDVTDSPIFIGTPALDVLRKAGVRAVQSTPVVNRRGKMIGMLSTHWGRPHHPDEQVLRYIDLLARQAADIIERKRAEEDEERFRVLMNHNPSLVFLKDESGRYVYLNSAYEKQFVLSDDWHGKTDYDFWPRESAELFRANDAEVLKSGRLHQFLEDSTDLQGKRYCWLNYKFPFTSSNGNRYVGGIGIDATDRVRAEEALRESEVRFRSYFEMPLLGILVTSREKGVISVNDKFCTMVGYSADELKNVSWDKITHQEDLARDVEQFNRVLAGEIDSYTMEKRFIHKNGASIPTILSVGCVRHPDYTVNYFVATVQDITERKLAEEALSNSEEKYRELVENANSIILKADRDGNITYFNEFAQRFFGYSETEIIGRNAIGTIIPASDSAGENLAAMLDDLLRHPEEYRTNTHENMCKNGERVWVSWTNKAIYDDAGNMSGLFSIGNDISQLKHAEEELKAAKQQAELYLDLMGHDISNMHQIILGNLELARGIMEEDGKLDSDDKEMIDASLATLQRSTKLIENIRNIQKLRSGEYKLEKTDLGVVLYDTVKAYSNLPGRDTSIGYEPVHDCYILANPLLKDVFNNLLDNAVKHCADPVHIGVSLARFTQDGKQYYRVAVEDDGRGVPDEMKTSIFARMNRGRSIAIGTGLGLYIVKTLVEGFGGTIRAEDRVPGDHTKGARFVVMLPAVETEGS